MNQKDFDNWLYSSFFGPPFIPQHVKEQGRLVADVPKRPSLEVYDSYNQNSFRDPELLRLHREGMPGFGTIVFSSIYMPTQIDNNHFAHCFKATELRKIVSYLTEELRVMELEERLLAKQIEALPVNHTQVEQTAKKRTSIRDLQIGDWVYIIDGNNVKAQKITKIVQEAATVHINVSFGFQTDEDVLIRHSRHVWLNYTIAQAALNARLLGGY